MSEPNGAWSHLFCLDCRHCATAADVKFENVTASRKFQGNPLSAPPPHGDPDCARITQKPKDRAGIAGLRTQILEVMLVEHILRPHKRLPSIRKQKAGAQIDQSVTADLQILG